MMAQRFSRPRSWPESFVPAPLFNNSRKAPNIPGNWITLSYRDHQVAVFFLTTVPLSIRRTFWLEQKFPPDHEDTNSCGQIHEP